MRNFHPTIFLYFLICFWAEVIPKDRFLLSYICNHNKVTELYIILTATLDNLISIKK